MLVLNCVHNLISFSVYPFTKRCDIKDCPVPNITYKAVHSSHVDHHMQQSCACSPLPPPHPNTTNKYQRHSHPPLSKSNIVYSTFRNKSTTLILDSPNPLSPATNTARALNPVKRYKHNLVRPSASPSLNLNVKYYCEFPHLNPRP